MSVRSPLSEHSGSVQWQHSQGGSQHFRRLLWDFLSNGVDGSVRIQRCAVVYQIFMITLIISWFFIDQQLSDDASQKCELILLCFFFMDYFLRIYSSVESVGVEMVPESFKARLIHRLHYIFEPFMILDLICNSSLLIDMVMSEQNFKGISTVRLLRLLSIFRMERNFHMFSPVLKVLQKKRHELGGAYGIALTTLLVSATMMYFIECSVNPKIDSMGKAMYWATTTLTTVGYGDIVPVSGSGQIVACLVAFVGVGLFAIPAGIIAAGFQESSRATGETQQPGTTPALEESSLTMQCHFDNKFDALQEEVRRLHEGQQQILAALHHMSTSGEVATQNMSAFTGPRWTTSADCHSGVHLASDR